MPNNRDSANKATNRAEARALSVNRDPVRPNAPAIEAEQLNTVDNRNPNAGQTGTNHNRESSIHTVVSDESAVSNNQFGTRTYAATASARYTGTIPKIMPNQSPLQMVSVDYSENRHASANRQVHIRSPPASSINNSERMDIDDDPAIVWPIGHVPQ